MLERIKLFNFEVHKKLDLVLDPKVTTIIGSSDVGKSSILRALGVVCLNQPSGDSFISHDESVAKIVLFVDGHKITREKGSDNCYSLDGKEFRAFGSGTIPDEIVSVLNVTESNFQWQLDPPFWFLESAGQVSRNLNRIVNLAMLDNALAEVASELRKARAAVDISKDRLAKLKEEKASLKWVKEFDTDLKALVDFAEGYALRSYDRVEFETSLKKAKELHEANDTKRQAAKMGIAATKLGAVWERLHIRKNTLETMLQEIKKQDRFVKRGTPDIKELDQIRKDGDVVANRRGEFESLYDRIIKTRSDLCVTRKRLKRLTKELKRKTKGRCPTCGQEIELSQLQSRTCTYQPRHQ